MKPSRSRRRAAATVPWPCVRCWPIHSSGNGTPRWRCSTNCSKPTGRTFPPSSRVSRPMAELVVGTDGGDSKTDLVLADTDGRILARVTGAGTRCYDNGIEATIADIMTLQQRARDEAGIPADRPIAAAAYFLANIDLPEDERAAAAVLARYAR